MHSMYHTIYLIFVSKNIVSHTGQKQQPTVSVKNNNNKKMFKQIVGVGVVVHVDTLYSHLSFIQQLFSKAMIYTNM